jgi:hypothetical protein
MNGWVRTESVNVYLPSVVAQSFYEVLGEEKTNKKDLWKEEFITVYLPSVVAQSF